ncbi:MAG: ketoacyl-ACP synthase III [Proteobacteria bacterium]|nr:ketoacyl-ACP synthase III [Pseudomonadota bacterium]
MRNAYISGSGAYVPPRVVTNNDLVNEYGLDTSDEWIQKRTGIKERRYAAVGVGPAELAVVASEQAIEAAGIDKSDIDMIIFATLSPEYAFPGSGVLLAEKLGLCDGTGATFVPALDIRNQCSGFVYGLTVAKGLIASGGAEHVLLVGGEKHSSGLDFTTRGRAVASLFGDGAGAVVVSATDEDRGIRAHKLGSDGRYAEMLCQQVWDCRRSHFFNLDENGNGVVPPDEMYTTMDGRKVFRHAVERMTEALMGVCMESGITGTDIDLFLFHQANMRINEYLANMMGIPPEKLVHNIDKYGNTTAATIPLLIAEAERDGRLKPGMKVAMIAFGSGFTWGAAIADW